MTPEQQEVLAALGEDFVTQAELLERLSPQAYAQLIPMACAGLVGVEAPPDGPVVFFRPGLDQERAR